MHLQASLCVFLQCPSIYSRGILYPWITVQYQYMPHELMYLSCNGMKVKCFVTWLLGLFLSCPLNSPLCQPLNEDYWWLSHFQLLEPSAVVIILILKLVTSFSVDSSNELVFATTWYIMNSSYSWIEICCMPNEC